MSYKLVAGGLTTLAYSNPTATQMGLTAVSVNSVSGPGAVANTMTERLRITNTGYLGVGTTDPQYMVDAAGDINTSGSLRTGGVVRIDETGAASLQTLDVSGATTFQDTISGTDAAFGAGVAIGTVGESAGELTIASSGAGSVTLTTATQTDDYSITIPTLAGDDIVCLQNLGNCAGGSGGVSTSGTVTTGALTKFDGSGGVTSSGLTESGTSLSYAGNIVANVDSGFSGNIFDLQKASSSVFRVGSSGLVTTAGGISGVAATGTNATGGNLALQAGSGTGSAGSGAISFSTASQAQDPFVKDVTPSGEFYQSSTPAVSANFSQTVTAGSNQVLLVTMATGHGGVSATSVTYGGVALTKLGGIRQTYDASYTEMWYLVNPNVGSATVSISLNTSATLYARAMVLTGVDQSTPFNTACTATGASTSITCSANTSGAGVVVSLLRSSAAYSSMGSEQVSVYGNETPPAYTSVSVKPTTTSTTSMTYTLSSSTHWGFVAAGVRLADPGVNPAGLTLVDTGTLEGGPLTERMRIDSSGLVGINTLNPQYQLDVNGEINATAGLRVDGIMRIDEAGVADFTQLNVSGASSLDSLTVATAVVTGNLEVQGATTVATITVNGHIITASGEPTTEVQTALDGGTVTIEGTDTIGTVTITTGAAPTAGALAKIIFNETYTNAPRVILSPSNDAAADFAYYKGTVSTTDFMVNAKDAPAASTTYVFDYFIAE